MNKKSLLIIAIVGVISIIICSLCAYGIYRLVKNDESSDDSKDTSETSTNEQKTSQTTSSTDTDTAIGTKKLIFIHHSTGENWLADYDGGLGSELAGNGYFVSDTNYGWGTDSIGDSTDIGHWWNWFRGPDSSTYLEELYKEGDQNSEYARDSSDPGGENEIIMFKSCFPNSDLKGSASAQVPNISNNPLKGEASDGQYHTVANAKGIYIDLLNYFETRQNKLFVVITAPPLGSNNTDSSTAANARTFNNWLVNDWLDDYNHDNVAVFDFYDVLTNHGQSNYAEFPTDEWDDHPSTEGNLMATEEFIPFLDSAYKTWKKD